MVCRVEVEAGKWNMIFVHGVTSAVLVVPKYVGRAVGRLIPYYYCDDVRWIVRRLRETADELSELDYDSWPEALKLVVPRRYAGKFVGYWLPWVADSLEEVWGVVGW